MPAPIISSPLIPELICSVSGLASLTKKGKECVSPAPFSRLSGCSVMGGVHGVSWIHRKQGNVNRHVFSCKFRESAQQDSKALPGA